MKDPIDTYLKMKRTKKLAYIETVFLLSIALALVVAILFEITSQVVK